MPTFEFGSFPTVWTLHWPKTILEIIKRYAEPRTQTDVIRHTKYYQQYLCLAKEDKYINSGVVVAECNGQITIYEH